METSEKTTLSPSLFLYALCIMRECVRDRVPETTENDRKLFNILNLDHKLSSYACMTALHFTCLTFSLLCDAE